MRGSPGESFATMRALPLRFTSTVALVASALCSRMTLAVVTRPVTVGPFNMARQVLGFLNSGDIKAVDYAVHGKLEGGLFGTKRFSDKGTFEMPTVAAGPN